MLNALLRLGSRAIYSTEQAYVPLAPQPYDHPKVVLLKLIAPSLETPYLISTPEEFECAPDIAGTQTLKTSYIFTAELTLGISII